MTAPRRPSRLASGLGTCALVVAAVALGALTWHAYVKASKLARASTCYDNVEALSVSFSMYRADHADRLPLAPNWCDALDSGYVKAWDPWRCPELPEVSCGYAYNAHLSGADAAVIASPDTLALVFDGGWGWNAAGGPALFAPRHRGCGTVLYVGGWRNCRRPEDLPGLTWNP